MNQREIFYKHIAQTSPALALEIKDAKGIYLYDTEGKSYDLIAGVSVSNLGHFILKSFKLFKNKPTNTLTPTYMENIF